MREIVPGSPEKRLPYHIRLTLPPLSAIILGTDDSGGRGISKEGN